MSLKDSIAFKQNYPDYVLPSRWVEQWKGTDEGGVNAKARLVALGFKDPHVLQSECSAPAPTNEAFTTTM
eukprot:12407764-Karenia_brevis.AAC.1